MTNKERKEFEKKAAEAFNRLPAWIKGKMDNVAITIEELVDEETVHDLHLDSHMDLLGLYRGVPKTNRENAGVAFPDNITLYVLPILDEADVKGKTVEDVIYETLWHEVAHHFGLGEADVEKREKEEFKD
jgi:acetylglutamate kinase